MRKTKLTKKLTEKLVDALKAGSFVESAVDYAGISKASYYGWRARAEKELTRFNKALENNSNARIIKSEKKYLEFLDAVDAALSEAEITAIYMIRAEFKNDWKSAAWYLERRYADRWGRKVVGFSNDDGTKDFANAFKTAISEVENDEHVRNGIVVPIKP